MAQTTEAACLLQSGSMYARRFGFKTASGEVIFAGVKPGGVSLYFGDAPIYHFDLDGRWQRAFVDGTHYLKGLDAIVRSIDRERESGAMVLVRETLHDAGTAELDASIRSVALALSDDLDSGQLEILPTPLKARSFTPEDFRSFLDRVAAWDSTAWLGHRERYLATYGPLPFLPPDCPNALILQATLGHAGGVAFGGGQATEHHARSSGEFREHAWAVAALTGRRIAQNRRVFLGGADVLRRPLEDVLAYLETIRTVFPTRQEQPAPDDSWDDFPVKLGSVHAFLDEFTPPLPDLDGWRRLRAAGLGQVTLGIESGDPEIRASFRRDWKDEDLRETVANLKAAEIGVGVVVLLGAGGRESAGGKVDGTADLLLSLPLGPADLVSLVDPHYVGASLGADGVGIEDTAVWLAAIKARWEGRLVKGPKIVVYNPLKRWA
jgi:hypothetical protein